MKFISAVLMTMALTFHAYSGDKPMTYTEPKQAQAFEKDKKYMAYIYTSKGLVVCELYTDTAPLSVTNFINLAKGGFYNNLTFHRVVPKFVVQGGDPSGNGTGGPGYTLPAEISHKHIKGALAWARLPDQVNPQKRSSGSQFYITLDKTPFLDGDYTVFGQTIEGMDIVDKIRMGDKIEKVEISSVIK
jgi:peptidyl-prolyl cis-trans isomerase B (cyclophilin B)